MSGLADRRCVRVKKGSPPLAPEAAAKMAAEVASWEIRGGKTLARTFKFPDFRSALAFVDRVGALADAEDHHPDIRLSWGKAGIELTTHSAGGLTDNDFILAAKIDRLS